MDAGNEKRMHNYRQRNKLETEQSQKKRKLDVGQSKEEKRWELYLEIKVRIRERKAGQRESYVESTRDYTYVASEQERAELE